MSKEKTENIEDLESLKGLTNIPKLKFDRNKGEVLVTNKQECRGIKDLDKKIKNLEVQQANTQRIIRQLELKLLKNQKLNETFHTKLMRLDEIKSK